MSLSEAEQSAAAEVAAAILGTAAAQGNENAQAVLAQESPAAPVAAPVERVYRNDPASSPTPAAEAAETVTEDEAVEPPNYEPDIPEDLQALLDDPDFDAEAAAEIQAEAEDTYIEDTEAATKVRALEKRNLYLEGQLVERSRKNWVAENLRAYPLLREYAKDEVEGIKATSRRAFARDAAALNTQLEKIAKPMLTDIAAARATWAATATTEARAEVKKAWGDPQGDQAGVGDAADLAERIAAAEKTGELKDVLKVMLEATPLV